ncbi:MAG: hypothetical protein RSE24_04255 [Oscillospiraceae bacterium]
MKKFLQGVMEWKIWASLMFTGSVFLYCIINLFLGYKSLEISTILSLLIVSAVGTFIQFLAFTEYIIKNLRYSIRMIIFIVPFSILLTACAIGFHWFPSEIAGAWIIFIVIFMLAFIGITIGFEIYFSVTEKKYDGLLGQYKKQKDNKK